MTPQAALSLHTGLIFDAVFQFGGVLTRTSPAKLLKSALFFIFAHVASPSVSSGRSDHDRAAVHPVRSDRHLLVGHDRLLSIRPRRRCTYTQT